MNTTPAAALLLSVFLAAGGDGTPPDTNRVSAKESTTAVPVAVDHATRGRRAPSGRGSGGLVVTAEELKRLAHRDAGYALQALRPHWFSARGFNAQPVAIFLNGFLLGDDSALARLPATSVTRATRLNGIEAAHRLGGSLGSGAILVETR
jgi:hypothetical protein